ncbi:glycosyltransferase [Pontiellaceae bacterium B12227]|nr:glycosyltransferase [Pontiellaceae bacterium B12227]
MNNRLKVLLCCYACDPGRGSEPGMGWNFVSNIALHHDVHVIVETKYQHPLEAYAIQHPDQVKNITFCFLPRTRWKLLRKIFPMSYYWTYRAWMKDAYKLAIELNEKHDFDLVHLVTLSGFREPGFFWKLPNPFIWGPIGGLSDSPWCLLPVLGLRGAFSLYVRNIANGLQKRYGFSCRKAAKHAHTILTKTSQDVVDIRNFWHKDSQLLTETGFEDRHQKHEPKTHEPGTPLHVCWAGIHEPRKNLELLLHALTLCKQPIQVHVLSKGSRTPIYKKLAAELGVADRVIFHGFVPREESFQIMSSCHAFVITSVRDDTPTVLFEAFRYALPVVAINHAGFGAVLDDTCGFKIPVQSFDQVVSDYARHLDFLASHEDERLRKSQGALDMCNNYTWDKKMDFLNRIYEEAVAVST